MIEARAGSADGLYFSKLDYLALHNLPGVAPAQIGQC